MAGAELRIPWRIEWRIEAQAAGEQAMARGLTDSDSASETLVKIA